MAFNQFKEAMATTPVLAVPNFTKPVIEIDACKQGVEVVRCKEGDQWLTLLKSF